MKQLLIAVLLTISLYSLAQDEAQVDQRFGVFGLKLETAFKKIPDSLHLKLIDKETKPHSKTYAVENSNFAKVGDHAFPVSLVFFNDTLMTIKVHNGLGHRELITLLETRFGKGKYTTTTSSKNVDVTWTGNLAEVIYNRTYFHLDEMEDMYYNSKRLLRVATAPVPAAIGADKF